MWTSYNPVANFSWYHLRPFSSLRIQFTDESIDYGYGNICNWNWTFGDGNNSIEESPIHQYKYEGLYNVTLSVTDDDGLIDTITFKVVASVLPAVNFTWIPSTPSILDTIEFIDLSQDTEGVIANWTWTFGDGNTSSEQHPVHQYEHHGLFNVTLTVRSINGSQRNSTKSIIVSNVGLVSRFTYTPLFPCVNDTVSFFDNSVDGFGNIVNWTWNFGDGNTSNEQHPVHSYSSSGQYTVCLTVMNDTGGSNVSCSSIIICSNNISIDVNQSLFDRGFRLMPGWDAAQEFIPSSSTLTRIDLYL